MLNTEATIGLARAARRAGAQALRLPLLDPRPVRTDGRHGPTRGGRTQADRCLRRIQTRGRTRSRRSSTSIGCLLRAVLSLWAGRQRQHGASDAALLAHPFHCRSVASGALPLAARAGKPVGGNRDRVLEAPGTLRRVLIAADLQALTIAEMIAAMRHGLEERQPNVFPLPAAGCFKSCSASPTEKKSTGGCPGPWSPIPRP